MRMTIRFKIMTGCLALTLLFGLLAAFNQVGQRRLGALALDIYDNGFMTVSYLRSAQIEFAQVSSTAGAPSADMSSDILSDLDVVVERAMSPRGKSQAKTLRAEVAAALPKLAVDRAVAIPVQKRFESVVESFADDGYRYRRSASALINAQIQQNWLAIGGCLVAAIAITLLISHLIAPRVVHAVRVAQSIAGGRLDNKIDVRGHGETADLLRALAMMQASIAAAMARIKALMDQQAAIHAGETALHNAQMSAALDNMSQGLCLFDADKRLVVANRRFASMFGVPTLGADVEGVLTAAGLSALIDVSGGEVEALSCELPDGRLIAVSQHSVDGGGWVGTYDDVSERRAAEARLAHMARHDVLTGLPNRLLFSEHTQQILAKEQTAGGAMLCLGLDRFKTINDTFGHAAGDALLMAVAERIKACTRDGDMVSRLGGDEFGIVQTSGTQPAAATSLASRLIEILAEPFEIDAQTVEIGVSIGIVLGENMTVARPDLLLQCADLALARAKADGGSCYRFFEAAMDMRMQARRALEVDLRGALGRDELELYYQPQVSVDRRLTGFEALLRWHHPRRGLVSPAEFIPLAEELGLIGALGDWVLKRACAAAALWPPHLKVAVNLSPVQFRGRVLTDDVSAALAASGLAPGRLELEITEAVLMGDDENVLQTLHLLRDLGVRIAMDDFGTGYSSLGYLRRFPFDKIKIDQSFVQGMTHRDDCMAIVRAVIGLGRSLGIAVNAEGVETEEQLAQLRDEGCGELQGYLFSKPQPEGAIAGMVLRLGPPVVDVVQERSKEAVLF